MVCPVFKEANIAQLVEQRIRNAQVVGSIPTVGSNQNAWFCLPLSV
jgi:hypothetical protein